MRRRPSVSQVEGEWRQIFHSLRANGGSSRLGCRCSWLSAQPNNFKELYSHLSTFQANNAPGSPTVQEDARAASGYESEEEPAPWKEKGLYHSPASELVVTRYRCTLSASYRCPLSVSCHCTALLRVTRYLSHTRQIIVDLSHTR